MKQKIKRLVLSLATIASFSLVTVPVAAQGVVEVGPTPTPAPTATAPVPAAETKAGVPDTGIAPQGANRAVLATIVFIGGSAAGAALGFGVVRLRKGYKLFS